MKREEERERDDNDTRERRKDGKRKGSGLEREIELKEQPQCLTGEMNEEQRYLGKGRKKEGRGKEEVGLAHMEGPY